MFMSHYPLADTTLELVTETTMSLPEARMVEVITAVVPEPVVKVTLPVSVVLEKSKCQMAPTTFGSVMTHPPTGAVPVYD